MANAPRMFNPAAFKAASTAARQAMAEQIETKHPSARKSYRELFALALRGWYLGDVYKSGGEHVRFLWLRGM